MKKTTRFLAVLTLVVAGAAWLRFAAAGARSGAGVTEPLADRPLDVFQGRLLDVAFRAASALPVMPHVKNRSRAQEEVVSACLELEQPRRALGYIEEIANWRRGMGYADLAFHCAEQGDAGGARRYLELARRVSEGPADEDEQEWRRDRIRAGIARTLLLLGDEQDAARIEAELTDTERGRVEAAKALRVPPEALDERLAALDAILATGALEQVRQAQDACLQLFERFYGDPERRAQVEERLRKSIERVPTLVGMELFLELAGIALDHGDRSAALDLAGEAQRVMESSLWTAEHHVPQAARLAALRHRAGDAEGARKRADATLEQYAARREEIVDIYRAETLCPLAEAYRALGDEAAARAIYGKALEEAVLNPNSRPRAEDLTAVCCSMAVHGVEPDSDLWTRITRIQEGLREPW